jgi:carboxyl-terminal processing protease
VLIENLPGICLGCLTTGNNMNNALGLTAVPSVTNVMYTYAAPPLDLAALTRSLARVGRAGGPSVEGALAAPGVGYLVIRVFSADVPARVFSEVRALQAQGLEALIVDLRDNPGGEVNACLELLGDFLDEGSELVTMIDADGDETVIRSHGSPRYRLPVGILVNRGTASAAEIFAGCLQAHGRAMVAGEATYGKDVGQVVVATQEGAVMATVARYRLPGGGEVRVATRREAPYV